MLMKKFSDYIILKKKHVTDDLILAWSSFQQVKVLLLFVQKKNQKKIFCEYSLCVCKRDIKCAYCEYIEHTVRFPHRVRLLAGFYVHVSGHIVQKLKKI